MDLAELVQAHRATIYAIAQHYGATNVRIFGSTARGEATERSDIDLLVHMDSERSLLDYVALRQDLEALLGRPVDVVTEKNLHWYIRDRVLAEARPL